MCLAAARRWLHCAAPGRRRHHGPRLGTLYASNVWGKNGHHPFFDSTHHNFHWAYYFNIVTIDKREAVVQSWRKLLLLTAKEVGPHIKTTLTLKLMQRKMDMKFFVANNF